MDYGYNYIYIDIQRITYTVYIGHICHILVKGLVGSLKLFWQQNTHKEYHAASTNYDRSNSYKEITDHLVGAGPITAVVDITHYTIKPTLIGSE